MVLLLPRDADPQHLETIGVRVVRSFLGRAPSGADIQQEALQSTIERLAPLHTPLSPVLPGDWQFMRGEPGQTFRQYVQSSPVVPAVEQRSIYIQPIGSFTMRERQVLHLTAEFLSRYFCLPVKVGWDLPLSVIPVYARRHHPASGEQQILSSYVLDRVLKPLLPDDAVAMLGMTTADMWPGWGWSYVIGQAAVEDRVGVWSTSRSGDPDASPDSYGLFLLRTLKTAAHETAHLLSVQHCTRYKCNMCGSSGRLESDRRPLSLCPECMAKVVWHTRCDPVRRYQQLMEFCMVNGLGEEAEVYRKMLLRLGGLETGP
jgi:archaemetzincin